MNYKKIVYDNQKTKGYKILSINDKFTTIQCNDCGAIKNLQIASLARNKDAHIHNQFCAKYYLNQAKIEIGNRAALNFHNTYRYIHERCCSSKCKDYKRYHGKLKYKDFCEYYKDCYPIYKEALKTHDSQELTIDRIDGTKGYEPENIRFVTMTENLRNKPNVKAVKATNTKTDTVITGVSFGDLANKFNCYPSVIHRAYKKHYLYRKVWKIEVC